MPTLKNFSINKKTRLFPRFAIIAVTSAVFLLAVNLIATPIKGGFYKIFSPVQKVFWVAGETSSSFVFSFLDAGSIEAENKLLEQENKNLLSQVVFLQSIKDANKAQSDISSACEDQNFDLVMASIAGLENNDIVSINKGSADGISEGMPVVSQQNVLYGRISKVYKNYSQVMLISSANSIVNVKIVQFQITEFDGPEIDGVVRGTGNLSGYLDLIPISSAIKSQDVIVTSAIEKHFPKNLLVGRVLRVEKDDQKPFQQAKVSLFLDVKATGNLFVITNFKR